MARWILDFARERHGLANRWNGLVEDNGVVVAGQVHGKLPIPVEAHRYHEPNGAGLGRASVLECAGPPRRYRDPSP